MSSRRPTRSLKLRIVWLSADGETQLGGSPGEALLFFPTRRLSRLQRQASACLYDPQPAVRCENRRQNRHGGPYLTGPELVCVASCAVIVRDVKPQLVARLAQCPRLNQKSLAFVALAGAAEAHDDELPLA